jgi:hypothetical protein
MKSLKSILFLSSIFCLLFYGCCKEDCTDDTNPDCPNYNPCKRVKPLKANFTSWNLATSNEYMKSIFINYDYTLQSAEDGATFTIDTTYNYDNWEWRIGSETILNQKTIYRSNFPKNSFIPVTLIARRTPNAKCFPNDKKIDTITKVYQFVETIPSGKEDSSSRIFGKFRGVFTNVPDLIDTFEFTVINTPNSLGLVCIDTFPFTTCSKNFGVYGMNLNYAYFRTTYGCDKYPNRKMSWFYLRFIDNVSNQVEVFINKGATDKNFPEMTWRGYKIN